MFLKNNKSGTSTKPSISRKESIPSIITQGMQLIGNIVSDGNVDFDGILDGNMRCAILTIRANGCIKGDAVADSVYIYGKVKGLIRARYVHLFPSCNVEGVIMHETITIEDGAIIDGKFKRTDKNKPNGESGDSTGSTSDGTDSMSSISNMNNEFSELVLEDEGTGGGGVKILENIRLIR